jgi:Type I phosphodiesterase / nucleotide pyrophosphatase
MKILLITLMALPCLAHSQTSKTRHVFIITTDGFRWQEVFNGGDSARLSKKKTSEASHAESDRYYGHREALLPFIWSVIATEGMILGNRKFNNKVSVRNVFNISYPGYNEILTGFADPVLIPNLRISNRNRNILDMYGKTLQTKSKVAAFTTWNLFPYILNSRKGSFYLTSGPCAERAGSPDLNTFCNALQYIKEYQPDLLFISFGETDEYAHQHRYGSYLSSAHQVDSLIGKLWEYIHSNPYYKDETTLIITTDHGRGRGWAWFTHGPFVIGSGQTWLAMIGPDVYAAGEMKVSSDVFAKQIPATVNFLLGEPFVVRYSKTGLPISVICEKQNAGNSHPLLVSVK